MDHYSIVINVKPLDKTHAGLTRHHSRPTMEGRTAERSRFRRGATPADATRARIAISARTTTTTQTGWLGKILTLHNKACCDYLNPYTAHAVRRACSSRVSRTCHSSWSRTTAPGIRPSPSFFSWYPHRFLSLSLQREGRTCTVKAGGLATAPNSVGCVYGPAVSRLDHLELSSARLALWDVSLFW